MIPQSTKEQVLNQSFFFLKKLQSVLVDSLKCHECFVVCVVTEFCGNVELCRLTEQVVFSDPYRVSTFNRWTTPYLDDDAKAVREDSTLKLEIAELKSMYVLRYHFQRVSITICLLLNHHCVYSFAVRFCERAQALIHGDLHTGSVMVTQDSTQVIDPEFSFYGPMGFDIGAYLGNLILAFFAQDGHAAEGNDRKVSNLYIQNSLSCNYVGFRLKQPYSNNAGIQAVDLESH